MPEEMKQFLQDGLEQYAPALLAVSEFRRQVFSRMQEVLDEYSSALAEVGLPNDELKPVGAKLDYSSLAENGSSIALQQNLGNGRYNQYRVEWDWSENDGEQLWAGAWIYLAKKPDRERLYAALEGRQPGTKTHLQQFNDGTSDFYRCFDPKDFHSFDQVFRALVIDLIEILSSVGGIQRFGSGEVVENVV